MTLIFQTVEKCHGDIEIETILIGNTNVITIGRMHQLQIQNDNSCKTSSQTNKQTSDVCVFLDVVVMCLVFVVA